MVKKILFFLLAFIIVFGLSNRSFFSNEYRVVNRYNNMVFIPINKFSIYLGEDDKTINFFSLKSNKNNEKFISNYLDKLESCYDGMYYYDFNRNISIYEYSYSNHKITIRYDSNNVCAIEHELDSNWSSKFKDAEYESIMYDGIVVEENKFNNLIDNLRTLDKSKVNYDIKAEDKILEVKFKKNDKIYECEIFMYNKKYVVLKMIYDDNIKIAKFNVDENYIDNYLK